MVADEFCTLPLPLDGNGRKSKMKRTQRWRESKGWNDARNCCQRYAQHERKNVHTSFDFQQCFLEPRFFISHFSFYLVISPWASACDQSYSCGDVWHRSRRKESSRVCILDINNHSAGICQLGECLSDETGHHVESATDRRLRWLIHSVTCPSFDVYRRKSVLLKSNFDVCSRMSVLLRRSLDLYSRNSVSLRSSLRDVPKGMTYNRTFFCDSACPHNLRKCLEWHEQFHAHKVWNFINWKNNRSFEIVQDIRVISK
jgi:hypothetical protein